MIKVSVLYPNASNATFDMKYYVAHHLPMVREKCAPECRGVGAEAGLSGGEPGSRATYIAIGYLMFDSVAAFQKSFGPNAPAIRADIPNYTNTTPIIQISEIAL